MIRGGGVKGRGGENLTIFDADLLIYSLNAQQLIKSVSIGIVNSS